MQYWRNVMYSQKTSRHSKSLLSPWREWYAGYARHRLGAVTAITLPHIITISAKRICSNCPVRCSLTITYQSTPSLQWTMVPYITLTYTDQLVLKTFETRDSTAQLSKLGEITTNGFQQLQCLLLFANRFIQLLSQTVVIRLQLCWPEAEHR